MNEWMVIDQEKQLLAMVRSNGQVLIRGAGASWAEMFDPLHAIVKTADTPLTLKGALKHQVYGLNQVTWNGSTALWEESSATPGVTRIPGSSEPGP